MKTLIQQIHIEEPFSFACRTYTTPDFETAWHKHTECELILIKEGAGTALIGDYIGNYNSGDIYFLSGNLPHWFRKSKPDAVGSVLVVHFTNDFLGDQFLKLPELRSIAQLLDNEFGLLINPSSKEMVSKWMIQMEKATGVERIFNLLSCLREVGKKDLQNILTSGQQPKNNQQDNSIIKDIIDFTFNNYLYNITLQEVADLSGMSIPTFCRFFKKNIKKTYFDFLKEIRIGQACKLLNTTEQSILEICYSCGYNSWPHFSKQFKDVKGISPKYFRKQYKTGII